MSPSSIQVLVQSQGPILMTLRLDSIEGHLERGPLGLILLVFRHCRDNRVGELPQDRLIHLDLILVALIHTHHVQIID